MNRFSEYRDENEELEQFDRDVHDAEESAMKAAWASEQPTHLPPAPLLAYITLKLLQTRSKIAMEQDNSLSIEQASLLHDVCVALCINPATVLGPYMDMVAPSGGVS